MNYFSFKKFVDKYALKKAATTNIKIQQISKPTWFVYQSVYER